MQRCCGVLFSARAGCDKIGVLMRHSTMYLWKMLVFPELYTERLHLRQLQADDIPALVKYANNKKISDYVKNIPHPYQEPDAVFRISYVVQGFKAKARYVFSIVHREQEELIGEIGLHMDNGGEVAQLGYWIAEPFW